MKRNLDLPILDARGNPLKDGNGADAPILTVGAAIHVAVISPGEGQSADDKRRCWKLAQKVANGGEVNFTVDEAKLVLERIDKFGFGPIVFGRIDEFLQADPA